MPKGMTQRDQRIAQLKKMRGQDFAMQVAPDFLVLTKEERSKAVRFLTTLNETVTREEATA